MIFWDFYDVICVSTYHFCRPWQGSSEPQSCSPDPLGLIGEASIPPPRAKLWPFVKIWLKALPDGLVRPYIWRKGPKVGHSAKSSGGAALGLKLEPLAINPQHSGDRRP